MLRPTLLFLLPVLAACGASHTGGPDAGRLDAALEADAAPVTPPSTTCLMACEQRTDQPAGFCGPEDCAAECSRVAGLSAEAQGAMEMCLRDNPLCFETVEGCVLFALYGETRTMEMALRGRGLSEWEGRTVVVALNTSGERDEREQTVRDGELDISLGEHDVSVRGSTPLVRGYVDLDGDGGCSEADVPFSLFAELAGDFDSPRYDARLPPSPDPSRGTGVCEWFER